MEDQVTDTVERVTGRRPKSLAEFAAEHVGVWTTDNTNPAPSM
ncbi:hypothetical protein OIN60_05465 [Paenibacillus sp. P96]|uniref:Uncharacterized protein n=1 Tax=Paenibacillus zeirhizosphaerae TaxID=2987519 RepID=A0ABT9FNA4_9BACL|nr:hypothetical protein [Paenibacillus sp. P96]MDP4096218.1 hypothetical protein [Paenibacillus sp. P96]